MDIQYEKFNIDQNKKIEFVCPSSISDKYLI